MHDASKVLMGTTKTSFRDVDNRAGEIEAGLICRLKTDGSVSIAAADGGALGISLGRSLSGTARTAIVRSGSKVPLLLTNSFTPVVGAQVHISDTTGKGVASGAGATGMNAIYVSAGLTAVKEDGTTVTAGATGGVAYIDMPGGL